VHGIPITFIVIASFLCPATASAKPLNQCLPGNVMAAYFGRPSPTPAQGPQTQTLNQLAMWIMTLKSMGIIPQEGQIFADIAATLPMLGQRPYAIALLDISAKELAPGSYRLKDMRAVLIVDTQGSQVAYDRRIRDLLATYTDAENGRIEALQIGEVGYHRLTDRRLTDWAVIEWAAVGDLLIVSVGQGAFEQVIDHVVRDTVSLAKDPWFQFAHRRCRGPAGKIEIDADLGHLKARLNEIIVGRTFNVLRELKLHDTQRLLWTLGFEGRALRSEIMTRESNNRNRYQILVGKELATPEVLAAIPAQASSYAVFRFPLADGFKQARQAYLNSRSFDARQRLSNGWARMEEEFGFDVESGLIEHLGDHLIIHTYPAHPMGLPILSTIWIQHKGPTSAVAQTVNRMMAAWQNYMNTPTETAPSIFSPRINRTEDGIWFLQLGLIGPAVALTDEWIVISFSPYAVRTNVAHLQTLPARPKTQPSTRRGGSF